MEKGIEFEVLGIAEAIRRSRLVVPPNQREYSWLHNVQVRDLLQDISNAIRTPNKPYFLGTIVLTRNGDMLEVADGQQRLATTTMIIAAIRDWYMSKGDQMIKTSLENDFLFTIDRQERERVPKLTLNIDDNQFFKNLVLEPRHEKEHQQRQRRSHKLIAKAFEEITKYIRSFEDQLGVENTRHTLEEWIDYLQKRANIVKLIVSDSENAFMMFETLNDRGLKTSQVDLVKNHIFKMSGDRLQESQRAWSSMKGAVESVSDNEDDVTMDFLRSACCIVSGITTKKDVMKKVREKTPSKSESIRIMILFEELSKDYAAILNPDHNKWNEYDISVRKSIQALNLFGVTQIRPLMLAVARYFNKQNTAIAFRKFVSWSVRFLILGYRGGRLDEGYARLSHKIFLQDVRNADELKREAEKIVIGDAEFRERFKTTKTRVAKMARYYLRSLETVARGESDPEFIPNDDTVINLEHIMPSSHNVDGWRHIDEQSFETQFKRLGNMALLQANKNSRAANLSFEEKKKIYEQSTFLLTNQLAEVDTWDVAEIENRQNIMADLAVRAWPL